MTTDAFDLKRVDVSWQACLQQGLAQMDKHYLTQLSQSTSWLPGPRQIFNAFSLPLNKVNYVLFGESPYPRAESANGYAFWDAAVAELWSPTGLSKKVNRATSLRHLIKMLLVADNALQKSDTSQAAITAISKAAYVQTNAELFTNFLNHGFLLLNAALVLQDQSPAKDARAWQPCIRECLTYLLTKRPQVTFILLGQIANTIDQLLKDVPVKKVYAEHPYNMSFVTNEKVIEFFKPLQLLRKR